MSNIRINIVTVLVYVLVSMLCTLPAVLRLGTHVTGSGGDPWQTMWRFEHKAIQLQEAIASGDIGGYIMAEFLGQSEPQLVNLSVWPWMPLQWVFGQPVTYNLVWLLSFVLSGIGMYALVIQISRLSEAKEPTMHVAAFLAGLAYMLIPFHVAHSFGHFGAMQMQWLPLIMALALSFYAKPALYKGTGLGALLVAQAWSEHHYTLWLGGITVVALVAFWREIRALFSQIRPVLYFFVPLTIAGFIVTASYLPTIRLAFMPNTSLDLGQEQLIRFSADPFAYFVPPAFHFLWGGLFERMYTEPGGFTGNISESTQFLGYTVLLFVAFFHQRIQKRAKWFLLILGTIFFVVSLGPKLHIFGSVTPLPLPYGLIDSLPGISAVRAVARAGAVVSLTVTSLFGLALATQLRRKMSAVIIAVLLLLEFTFVPMVTQSAKLSSAYDAVAQLPGSTILEVPATTNYTIASRALYAQRQHGKEVVGNIALERAMDEEDFALAKQLPGVRQLLLLRTTDMREDRTEFFEQDLTDSLLDSMELLGAYGILIHTDSLSVLQRSAVEKYLESTTGFSKRTYGDIDLYTRDEQQAGDGILLMRQDGWENIGYDQKRDSVFAEVSTQATAVIHNLREQNMTAQVSFTLPPENNGEGVLLLDGNPVDTISSSGSETYTLNLSPGEHLVTFTVTSPTKIIIQNPTLKLLP